MFLTGAATSAADILTSSLTTAASDMTAGIGAAAPIAMGVGATILVITLGWKLFKRVSK